MVNTGFFIYLKGSK